MVHGGPSGLAGRLDGRVSAPSALPQSLEIVHGEVEGRSQKDDSLLGLTNHAAIWGLDHRAYHPLMGLPFVHVFLQSHARKACIAAEIAGSVTQ